MLALVAGAFGLEHCPQVVGFAPQSERLVAQAPPAYQEPALYGAPTLKTNAVHIALSTSRIQQIPNVPHESLLMAREPIQPRSTQADSKPRESNSLHRTASGTVRMLQTSSPDSQVRSHIRAISDVEPSQPAVGIMQWVTVTAWQSGDGSRVVLTTARTRTLPREVSDTPAATGDAPELEQQPDARPDQVHPYAAVPVRGGWLILQL